MRRMLESTTGGKHLGRALLLGLVALAAAPAAAADGEVNPAPPGPELLLPTHRDVSPPLRDVLAPAAPATGFSVEVNPLRAPSLPPRPDVRGKPDPGRQLAAQPFAGAAPTPAPLLSFPGLSDDDNAAVIGIRIVPPDTEGDIGPNHYVQWINSILAVWDVSRAPDGTPTAATLDAGFGIRAGNSIWAGFGGNCQVNNDGDPIVLYDHLADRWFLSQFSIDEGVQCIAVSTTPDPTGSYFRYAYLVSPGESNDYPKFGLMPEAYYLSLRDFPSSPNFAGAVAFDRPALLAGAASPVAVKFSLPCLSNDCPDGIQPPHLEGPAPPASTPGIFTRAWDDDFDGPLTGADGYRLWELDPDFATPSNSTFTELPFVVGTPYDSNVCGFFNRNCIPQNSSSQLLDPIDELQMYRAQYRHFAGSHDSIVLNTTVDAGGDRAGIRWAELRNSGGGWTLFQDGTYAPADGLQRWMGSAAMDEAGNVALGYSVSSSTLDPSVRYTSREAGDPLGTLPGGEVTLIAGTGAQTGANRWGDYSSMSVDPVAGCTFWYTQEYYEETASFDFKTRIGVFQMPSCGATGCTQDSDCDNGLFCDGAETCETGSGVCQPGGDPCAAGQTCNEKDDVCEECPDDLDVEGPEVIVGPDTRRAIVTIDVLGAVTVADGGELYLVAGVRVSFDDGFAVQSGGLLEVILSSTPCP